MCVIFFPQLRLDSWADGLADCKARDVEFLTCLFFKVFYKFYQYAFCSFVFKGNNI